MLLPCALLQGLSPLLRRDVRDAAGARGCAGKDVTAGVRRPRDGRGEMAERKSSRGSMLTQDLYDLSMPAALGPGEGCSPWLVIGKRCWRAA